MKKIIIVGLVLFIGMINVQGCGNSCSKEDLVVISGNRITGLSEWTGNNYYAIGFFLSDSHGQETFVWTHYTKNEKLFLKSLSYIRREAENHGEGFLEIKGCYDDEGDFIMTSIIANGEDLIWEKIE